MININNTLGGSSTTVNDVTKYIDFVAIIECQNGNPNGDPDTEGRPRIVRYGTMDCGYITCTSLKRRIRDYINDEDWATRLFGRAEGRIRGSVQIADFRTHHSVTVNDDFEKPYLSKIKYGLYVCNGLYSPATGKDNGVSSEDLEKFFVGLKHAFGKKSFRLGNTDILKAVVFQHDNDRKVNRSELKKMLTPTLNDGVDVPNGRNDFTFNSDSVLQQFALENEITLTIL